MDTYGLTREQIFIGLYDSLVNAACSLDNKTKQDLVYGIRHKIAKELKESFNFNIDTKIPYSQCPIKLFFNSLIGINYIYTTRKKSLYPQAILADYDGGVVTYDAVWATGKKWDLYNLSEKCKTLCRLADIASVLDSDSHTQVGCVADDGKEVVIDVIESYRFDTHNTLCNNICFKRVFIPVDTFIEQASLQETISGE